MRRAVRTVIDIGRRSLRRFVELEGVARSIARGSVLAEPAPARPGAPRSGGEPAEHRSGLQQASSP